MNFIKDVENPNVKDGKNIYNSNNMGWYSNNKSSNSSYKTGIGVDENTSNMVKNIYDMAGNMCEWTMEACSSVYRVGRGSYYDNPGSHYPASGRYKGSPGYAGRNYGFRCALYIK